MSTPGTPDPGSCDVQVAGTDARVDRQRPQQPYQRLEVAAAAGVESEAVVDRQRGRLRAGVRGTPRRLRGHRRVEVQTQPGQASRLERGHQERVVRRTLRQAARADQARVREVGILGQYRGQPGRDRRPVGRDELGLVRPEVAVDVHVRPGPQLGGVGQRGEVGDRDRGQRCARRDAGLGELRLGQHHQADPRSQPAVAEVGRGRRVPPREVLVVELDVGQVVGFEVGDAGARFGAHDRPAIHADDVARPEERDLLLYRQRVHARTVEPDAVQAQRDRYLRPEHHGRVAVGGADLVGEALAQPRQERVRTG